jgi:ribA/ribD-fused uncharacterized protein
MIDKFEGKYSFLSNYYNSPVTYNGFTFQSSEAAFQAQKSLKPGEQRKFTRLAPNKAKTKGKLIVLREDWEEVKDRIMYEIVKAKFSQNVALKEKLLETEDEELIEGNTWGDTYWGVYNRRGKNKLGKILMKVREEFRNA